MISQAPEYSETKILMLVPSLSLMRQTYHKIVNYGETPGLLVGSDVSLIAPNSSALVPTTDPAVISEALAKRGRMFIISTYQSATLLAEHVNPRDGVSDISLIIFDEAHRTCGKQDGLFSRLLNPSRRQAGCELRCLPNRLFMTATPKFEAGEVTMRNADVFGSIAYKYHLRRGIDEGYVNDFRVCLVPESEGAVKSITSSFSHCAEKCRTAKMIVYCRSIRHSVELCVSVKKEYARMPPSDRVQCFVAHSRMPRSSVNSVFDEFSNTDAPCILFNCRLFQEGVECPRLNAVYFASPRNSPRDIIQTMCRPLNRLEGKPPSIVFVPCCPEFQEIGSARLPGLQGTPPVSDDDRFGHLIPFADALRDEDPKFYDFLLNAPGSSEYALDWLGGGEEFGGRAAAIRAFKHVIKYRGCSRNQLTKPDQVPWAVAISELRNCVARRNRYPKQNERVIYGDSDSPDTSDLLNLGGVYKWCVEQWKATRNGTRKIKLDPYQVADLEALPHWMPYGVEGPYALSVVAPYLRDLLRSLRSRNELRSVGINVSNGGYIGFDATVFERLSGFLTTINQQDGKNRCSVSAEKRELMESVGAEFCLRFLRARFPDGTADLSKKTFIQEANGRFQALAKSLGREGCRTDPRIQIPYPGYPEKHALMECPTTSPEDYAESKTRALLKKKKTP